jgi:hypothetical protein
VAALSGCHHVDEVSHHGPVAPARLSALLALAVSAKAQSGRSRHSQTDPRDVLCQPALGCAAHPWRLLKLGIEISQATVAKYMLRRPRTPSPTWRSFLSNEALGIAAIDMFIVPSATFRLLFLCSSY